MTGKRLQDLKKVIRLADQVPYSAGNKFHAHLKPEVAMELVERIEFLEAKLKRIECMDCGGTELKHRSDCQWRDKPDAPKNH